jgi:hypothetical protein
MPAHGMDVALATRKVTITLEQDQVQVKREPVSVGHGHRPTLMAREHKRRQGTVDQLDV